MVMVCLRLYFSSTRVIPESKNRKIKEERWFKGMMYPGLDCQRMCAAVLYDMNATDTKLFTHIFRCMERFKGRLF